MRRCTAPYDAEQKSQSAVDVGGSQRRQHDVGGAQRRQHDAGSRNSAMSGRCRKDLSTLVAVTTTTEQTLSRRLQENKPCHDDYRRTKHVTTTTGEQTLSRRLQENKPCHDDYRRTNAVTTTTGQKTLSRRLQENKRCHDDYRRTNTVTTTTGEQTLSRRLQENKRCHDDGETQDSAGGSAQKTRWRFTFSDRQQSALSILLLVPYKSGDAKCNVARMCVGLGVCCLCPFRPFMPCTAESSLLSGHSLFFSCLSFVSHLSTHTLIVVYIYAS